jgi:hypothetical protein
LSLKIMLPNESLATLLTYIGPLSTVTLFMCLKVT